MSWAEEQMFFLEPSPARNLERIKTQYREVGRVLQV